MARDWPDDRIAELEAEVDDRKAQMKAALDRIAKLEEKLRRSSRSSTLDHLAERVGDEAVETTKAKGYI